MGVSRMARGGHGLPKELLGPAMPYPCTLCHWATPETAFWEFQRWPARRVGGLRPSSTEETYYHSEPQSLLNTVHLSAFKKFDAVCGTGQFISRCNFYILSHPCRRLQKFV
jgi:hypothetical protein